MSQPFNPQPHLIQLPRKVKDKATGHYITVYDDYLEVKWRLCWFRDRYPHGTIETEELCVDLDRGYARYKARVTDGEGGSATGHGTETKADFADYCERAETRALGRALAAMGIGTQFVGAELDELPHVADAPVTTTTPASDVTHETHTGRFLPLPVGALPQKSVLHQLSLLLLRLKQSILSSFLTFEAKPPVGEGTPGAATNGHRPAADPDEGLAHPTEAHLSALRTLALDTCHDDIEAFETRLRRTAGLPAHASLAPKLLSRTLSMKTYMEVYGWYVNLEKQLAKGKGKEASSADDTTPQPTPQSTTASTEAPTAVPSVGTSASASAPSSDDATERDRQRLRAEVAQWDLRISDKERAHVIVHNSYSRARQLLWQTRVDAPAATPIESAAD